MKDALRGTFPEVSGASVRKGCISECASEMLLHTHSSPDVTSLQEHGGPVHHEATLGLPGPSHGGKLHVCAKQGGGGARYLGTSDWHRGSEKLELWGL